MTPDALPVIALGPLVGLVVNAVLLFLCLAARIRQPRYRPLSGLAAFYLACLAYFLGFTLLHFQASPRGVVFWYAVLMLGLSWAPAAWLYFLATLAERRARWLLRWCVAAAIVFTAAIIFVPGPATLGMPLEPAMGDAIVRPHSWLLRPLVYANCLGSGLIFLYLVNFRWWRLRDQPNYIRAINLGLAIWMLTGIHDISLSLDLSVHFGYTLLWLGTVFLSLFLAVAVTYHIRHLEDDLLESQERFRLLAETTGDALYRLRYRDMTYDYLSPGIKLLTGYSPEEIAQIGLAGLVEAIQSPTGEDLSRQELTWQRQARTTHEFHADYLVRTKTGEARWLADHSFPWLDQEGKVLGSVGVLTDITERKRAEEELHRAQALLMAAIEQSPAGIVITEPPDGTVRVANSQSQGIWCIPSPDQGGYGRDEGHESWSAFLPDGTPVSDEDLPLRRVLSHGETIQDQELLLRRSDGNSRWMLVNAAPVRDPQGGIMAGVAVYTDLTERRRIIRALEEAEGNFRTVLENAYEGVAVVQRWRLVFVNPVIEASTGFTASELVGRKGTDLVAPRDREAVTAALTADPGQGGGSPTLEFRFLAKDGSERWALVNAVRIQWEDLPALLLLFNNIHERKMTEEALKRSERQYRQVIDSVSDIIYTHDMDGRFLSINAAVSRILGYAPEEVVGLPISDFMLPEHREAFYTEYLPTLRNKGQLAGVTAYVTHDGQQRYVEFRSRVGPRAEGGKMVSGIGRDITERMLAKARVGELQNQLVQSQKLEAVGTLAGGVAHEFNNILMSIKGYTQLLNLEARGEPRLADYLNKVDEATRRAAELTSRMLTFSRRESGERGALDLNDSVREMRRLLEKTLPMSVQIALDLDAAPVKVQVNASQLDQVMLNLAVNARDAMPQGGLLIFSTRHRELDEDFCRSHPWAQPGPYAVLKVTDQGQGMEPEVRERIFEPFFTTKDPGQGTGLGMSVVYSIVSSHGGGIEVSSRPGRGTSLTIYLPELQGDTSIELQPEQGPPLPRGGGERILVVDDEESVREICRQALEGFGYQVETAANGEEALARYSQAGRDGQPVDLVILDLSMPVMDGRTCYLRLRELDPTARVMVASGHRGDDKALAEDLPGLTAVLQKPFDLSSLLQRVGQTLGRA